MKNDLKSKTRLAFIQILFQHISNKKNINEIFDEFNLKYKSTNVETFGNKNIIKFEFNSNLLRKLINFYINYKDKVDYESLINKFIKFDRIFRKWDIINQSIILASLSELEYTDSSKIKIVINDYINVSKSFVNQTDIGTINALLDKIIHEPKN